MLTPPWLRPTCGVKDHGRRVNAADVRASWELPLANGEFLYLATVLDCFSRKVVGWSIADHMRASLVADALRMVARVRGSLDGAVFHTDHGVQDGLLIVATLACSDRR